MDKIEPPMAADSAKPVAAVSDAGFPRWTETLRDGSVVSIRPICKQDIDLERAFIEGLSPGSSRYRFFGQMPHPGDGFVRRLTDIDLSVNAGMRDLARFLGFKRRPHPSDGTLVIHTLTL